VDNWNKLPEEVKTSQNGELFKNRLKNYRDGNYRRADPVKVMDNGRYNNHDRK
jgi:hypothetical protein